MSCPLPETFSGSPVPCAQPAIRVLHHPAQVFLQLHLRSVLTLEFRGFGPDEFLLRKGSQVALSYPGGLSISTGLSRPHGMEFRAQHVVATLCK